MSIFHFRRKRRNKELAKLIAANASQRDSAEDPFSSFSQVREEDKAIADATEFATKVLQNRDKNGSEKQQYQPDKVAKPRRATPFSWKTFLRYMKPFAAAYVVIAVPLVFILGMGMPVLVFGSLTAVGVFSLALGLGLLGGMPVASVGVAGLGFVAAMLLTAAIVLTVLAVKHYRKPTITPLPVVITNNESGLGNLLQGSNADIQKSLGSSTSSVRDFKDEDDQEELLLNSKLTTVRKGADPDEAGTKKDSENGFDTDLSVSTNSI